MFSFSTENLSIHNKIKGDLGYVMSVALTDIFS